MKQSGSSIRECPTRWALAVFFAAVALPVRGQIAATSLPPATPKAPSPIAAPLPASHPEPNLVDQRIRLWQVQVARDPEYWGSYNRLAAAYAQKARETGDISYFQLAETSLQQSLKLESTHAEAAPAFTQLATVHLAEHRFSEAADDVAKAIALLPNDLAAYPYAGDAQLELGNYDASQKFYAHLADPNDGRPHPGIEFLAASHGAGLHWIHGDIAQASDDLEHAITLSQQLHMPAENIAWTQFMLGEQFFQAGNLAAAEQQETAALSSFPRYHRALAAMGRIRAAQRRLPESIAFYQQAIAIIPLPLYVAALGDVYRASGDHASAEKQFALVEFIGKLNAINQQVYNRELALFYADHDRKLPDALTLAQKELEVRHDVYTSDALAWALLKNRQPARAREEIDRALRLGTQDALLEYHAGMIYAANADPRKAQQHLRRALAINPHFHVLFAEQASRALAQLQAQLQPATSPARTAAPETAHADPR
jgi:tetratricopeptide (TPR) repeat protein